MLRLFLSSLKLMAILPLLWALGGAPVAANVSKERIDQFLSITGFDYALRAMSDASEDVGDMLGADLGDFGDNWKRLAAEVFDERAILEEARDMLAQSITPELLDHAETFYGSDLGKRLVRIENIAHHEDDTTQIEGGTLIIEQLLRTGDERLAALQRFIRATDPENHSIIAWEEMQIRFLMAAAAAGVIDLTLDEPDMREAMREQRPQIIMALSTANLATSAFTYQEFNTDEINAYTDALENPTMRRVYELLSGVQWAILTKKFEELAPKLADLYPEEEL